MQRYVGLDVHSKNSVFVIQDRRGRAVGDGKVPTDREGLQQMRDRFDLPAGTQVALESGTVAFFVADRLNELGLRPVVIDAREVRVKASRPLQKSDRRDARELCEGLRRGIYRSIVSVPPPGIRLLREALGRRRHFVNLKTAEVNAVKRLLRTVPVVQARGQLHRLGPTDKSIRRSGPLRSHHTTRIQRTAGHALRGRSPRKPSQPSLEPLLQPIVYTTRLPDGRCGGGTSPEPHSLRHAARWNHIHR